MRMKSVLNESDILHRMTREEAIHVKGGGVVPSQPESLCTKPVGGGCIVPADPSCGKQAAIICIAPLDSACPKPVLPFIDCLLSGCGGPQDGCTQPVSLD